METFINGYSQLIDKRLAIMKDRKVNGTLALETVEFSRVLERRAGVNNATSTKVTLPKDLEGLTVLVIVPRKKQGAVFQ